MKFGDSATEEQRNGSNYRPANDKAMFKMPICMPNDLKEQAHNAGFSRSLWPASPARPARPARPSCNNMVLMESYFFCASVRLGVLLISAIAALKSTVIMWMIFTDGTSFLFSLGNILENHYRTSTIIRESVDWVEQYPKELMMFFQLYSFCHIITCILAAYGAYKLKKYHVIPLAVFEFFYTVQVVVFTIIALRIARHIVPLATLILLTLGLTFYAMLVAYDTLLLIAFVQVMFLVRTEQYQRLYGADPLVPLANGKAYSRSASGNPTSKQPIIIYVMPKPGQKLWDMPQIKWWQYQVTGNRVLQNTPGEVPSGYFHRKELLSNVLLRNAINEDYVQRAV